MKTGRTGMLHWIAVAFLIVSSSHIWAQQSRSVLAQDVESYQRLNLKEGNRPEIWEDGNRTKSERGTYEWWYFDSHLEDGSTVVLTYIVANPFSNPKRSRPAVGINIDRPDGTSIEKIVEYKGKEYRSSSTQCDVKIGPNYFAGDLDHYSIHFEDSDLTLDISLDKTAESWRPATGHLYFGDQGDYFAWVVPVPEGKAKVKYNYKGQSFSSEGSGYHDHNWGNKLMIKLINHWYWSRTKIGPYSIIAAEIIAEKKYNNHSIVVYSLSKDGTVIADDGERVKLYRTHEKMQKSGKPLSENLIFQYQTDTVTYELELEQTRLLMNTPILDKVLKHKYQKFMVRMLTGFDGAYCRMTGTATLSILREGKPTEKYINKDSFWELMFFGDVEK